MTWKAWPLIIVGAMFEECHTLCDSQSPFHRFLIKLVVILTTNWFYVSTQLFILFQWHSKVIIPVIQLLPHFFLIISIYCWTCSCPMHMHNFCSWMSSNHFFCYILEKDICFVQIWWIKASNVLIIYSTIAAHDLLYYWIKWHSS